MAKAAPDSKGSDFWLAFMRNYDGSTELSLFITGDTSTTGTVTIPGLAFSTGFSVTPGTVTTVTLPNSAMVFTGDGIENKGIHVTAGAEVTVYGLNRILATTDAFLGLPTDILGTDYIVLGYQNSDVVNETEFGVVGTQNGTVVTIIPSVTTGSHLAGVPYTVTLNQGEVYQLVNSNAAPADLSGTEISSTLPVAVYGGHACANIPPGFFFCDHVVEQMPPTTAWGKEFAAMPLATRTNGDTFRFLASTAGTVVNVNGAPVANLNRGQLHEMIITGPAHITSTEPILVAQYSNGTSFDGVTSDPFEMLIPPYEQFLGGYTVTTPASGFSINYINIVAPNSAVGLITIDGSPIPAGSYTAIGISGFSGTQVPVSLGSHNLAGPQPFGAFMYGFDNADSYGYPGGMSLAPIARVTSVTLAPKTDTNPVGVEHCLTATVRDQNSNPLEGVRVDFEVTGANATTGFSFTNASGVATFCYTGTNAGADTITATVGTISDTATKTYVAAETTIRCAADFNTLGTNRAWGGEYPGASATTAGCANWGENSFWVSPPFGKLTSRNISFNPNKRPVITSANIALQRAGRLASLDAYNGGTGPTTVTITCGSQTKTQVLSPGELATITTGFVAFCGNVGLSNTNAAATNFDSFVFEFPALVDETLVIFNDKTGQNQNLTGQYPVGLIDWGTSAAGAFYHAGPRGAFSTKSASLRVGKVSGSFSYVADADGKIIESFQVYNRGGAASTVNLQCGAQSAGGSINPGQVMTIITGWTLPCVSTTWSSTNSWDTNFDNVLVDDDVAD